MPKGGKKVLKVEGMGKCLKVDRWRVPDVCRFRSHVTARQGLDEDCSCCKIAVFIDRLLVGTETLNEDPVLPVVRFGRLFVHLGTETLGGGLVLLQAAVNCVAVKHWCGEKSDVVVRCCSEPPFSFFDVAFPLFIPPGLVVSKGEHSLIKCDVY